MENQESVQNSQILEERLNNPLYLIPIYGLLKFMKDTRHDRTRDDIPIRDYKMIEDRKEGLMFYTAYIGGFSLYGLSELTSLIEKLF